MRKKIELWASQENDELDVFYIKDGGKDIQGDFAYWIEVSE